MTETTTPTLFACFLCEKGFQFGPHRYNGRAVPVWDIGVCDLCFTGNHDGLNPKEYPKLIRHLRERGIAMEIKPGGWLAWPPGT